MKKEDMTVAKVLSCIESLTKEVDEKLEEMYDISHYIEDSDLDSSYEVTKFYAMLVHIKKARQELSMFEANRSSLEKRILEKEKS